jgi:hypothetical protein
MDFPNTRWSTILLLIAPIYGGDLCSLSPDRPLNRDYLTLCRPEPVSQDEKTAVLQSLPREAAITTLNPAQRAKLDAVAAVLRVHHRDNVYEIRLIDVPQAWTGLHGRAVLLISAPALDVLNAAELQALIAHEAGHEYLFIEYESARAAGDHARLRQLETACDAIAVLTLTQLGIPAARLASAIEKIYWYNRKRFGLALDESSYPTLKDRRKSIKWGRLPACRPIFNRPFPGTEQIPAPPQPSHNSRK